MPDLSPALTMGAILSQVTVMAAVLGTMVMVAVVGPGVKCEVKQVPSEPGSSFDFSEVDGDGSGCVEGAEELSKFRLMVGNILGQALHLPDVERTLRAGRITHSADVNGDGRICECDLLSILLTETTGPGLHRHAFRVYEDGSFFDDVDSDKDGWVGEDGGEMAALTHKLAQCLKPVKARAVVDAMAALQQDDGKLSRDEYLLFLKSAQQMGVSGSPPNPQTGVHHDRPRVPLPPSGHLSHPLQESQGKGPIAGNQDQNIQYNRHGSESTSRQLPTARVLRYPAIPGQPFMLINQPGGPPTAGSQTPPQSVHLHPAHQPGNVPNIQSDNQPINPTGGKLASQSNSHQSSHSIVKPSNQSDVQQSIQLDGKQPQALPTPSNFLSSARPDSPVHDLQTSTLAAVPKAGNEESSSAADGKDQGKDLQRQLTDVKQKVEHTAIKVTPNPYVPEKEGAGPEEKEKNKTVRSVMAQA